MTHATRPHDTPPPDAPSDFWSTYGYELGPILHTARGQWWDSGGDIIWARLIARRHDYTGHIEMAVQIYHPDDANWYVPQGHDSREYRNALSVVLDSLANKLMAAQEEMTNP